MAIGSSSIAQATDYQGNPGNYQAQLGMLGPGDTLFLEAGNYASGLSIQGMNGADGAPIIISGPTGGAPAILLGRACCNTISITNSSYIVIRNLEIDLRGEAVDGVKAESNGTFAHHITIENLRIHNFGGDQQTVGINTKSTAWDWLIRGNVIEDAGTGIYLGDSNGAAPFVRGVIEYNLITNPIGYDMQIKHQVPRPNVAGLPTTPSVTLIRHNVFTKAARSSTADLARPNLLVGAFPENGAGANDRYEIYGNFLYQNSSMTEGLFQGEGNVAFHDNILVNDFGAGLSFQPLNGPPKEISIYNNSVFTRDTGIRVSGANTGFRQVVLGNAVFADTPLSGGEQVDNVTGARNDAARFFANVTLALGQLDLFPNAGMLEGAPLDLSAFAQHTDFDRDFNGTSKSRTFRGAYSGSGANPGWRLGQEIKVLDPGPPPADGGVNPDANAPDAFVPPADGGVINPDAASNADASGPLDGSLADARAPAGGGGRDRLGGGCRCVSNAGASQLLLLWGAALLFFVRRKFLLGSHEARNRRT